MTHLTVFRRGLPVIIVSLLLPTGALFSQAPAEVQNLEVQTSGDLSWDPVAGADFYNIYHAQGGGTNRISPLTCLDYSIPAISLAAAEPDLGQILAFIVTGESTAGGEGSPGTRPDLAAGRCRVPPDEERLFRPGQGPEALRLHI